MGDSNPLPHSSPLKEAAHIAGCGPGNAGSRLELVDQVGSGEELIAGGSVVVAELVPGVIESSLRPQHDGAAEVLGRVEGVLGVLGGDTGALALLVVQEVGTEADHQLGVDLAVDIVHDSVFGCGAGRHTAGAEGSVGSEFGGGGVD